MLWYTTNSSISTSPGGNLKEPIIKNSIIYVVGTTFGTTTLQGNNKKLVEISTTTVPISDVLVGTTLVFKMFNFKKVLKWKHARENHHHRFHTNRTSGRSSHWQQWRSTPLEIHKTKLPKN
jgi:hypothetical protein